ncbi:MAG: amidase [Proteobacteria bacterium]|nr:amidase [Pseudomonadota bacterium]
MPTAAAVPFEETSIAALGAALDAGRLSAVDLLQAYLKRIDAYDRNGPTLRSVRMVNPDAPAIAAEADRQRMLAGRRKGPLHGIPILIKDNIATADRLTTAAGSVALADASAKRDAFIARALREAGAIILGKANMTEFANFMAVGMPAGYSSLGGQVLNPYATQVDGDCIPIVIPGGSSSGSAVAAAANLAAAAIGTETSGSLLSPASANGLVTVKPTVGLISRAGIIPIAASQDIAGPLARTVEDAAILLGALTGIDADDATTSARDRRAHGDYTQFLDRDRIKGARIGVPRAKDDPANDVFYGKLTEEQAAIMNAAIACLNDLGATVIEAVIPTAGRVGGPGSVIDVTVTNRFSPLNGKTAPVSTVFFYEFKRGLEDYLRDYAKGGSIGRLGQIIAFNEADPGRALRFGQDLLLRAESTNGDLDQAEYRDARRFDLESAQAGLDGYFAQHRLDAVLFPANIGAAIAAKAGYPSVSVPAGFQNRAGERATPPYPFGATFAGPAYSEPTLLAFAYAFEQATQWRRPPPNLGPL